MGCADPLEGGSAQPISVLYITKDEVVGGELSLAEPQPRPPSSVGDSAFEVVTSTAAVDTIVPATVAVLVVVDPPGDSAVLVEVEVWVVSLAVVVAVWVLVVSASASVAVLVVEVTVTVDGVTVDDVAVVDVEHTKPHIWGHSCLAYCSSSPDSVQSD